MMDPNFVRGGCTVITNIGLTKIQASRVAELIKTFPGTHDVQVVRDQKGPLGWEVQYRVAVPGTVGWLSLERRTSLT
jgi:hypothetical protein